MKLLWLAITTSSFAMQTAQAQVRPSPPAGTSGSVTVEADAPEAQEQAERATQNRGPEAGASAPPAGEAEPNDIVVTGYRASLGSAQEIKRQSNSIVDAVVAQDIGKLPDNTASESVARVTGVQVDRSADDANGVLVRGLSDVATTFNGRDIFTDSGRRTALQDFPAGALAGLEVYKSGTADLLEPGIGGLINVRTRRPFDFDGLEIAGGLRGTYNDQSKKIDPLGNLLISDRADTAIGEIGVLVNAAYTQQRYRNTVRYASGSIPQTINPAAIVDPASIGRDFRIPESVGIFTSGGKRWRPSVNAAVQWKPASSLELYYDFLWQGFRSEREDDFFDASLNGSGITPLNAPAGFTPAVPTFSDVQLVEGKPDQVAHLIKTGGRRPETYRRLTNDQTDTYQAAGGLKWDIGPAHLSTDIAYTRSRFKAHQWSVNTAFNGAPTVDVDFFADKGTAFDLPGFDASDPANYIWRGYYENRFYSKGTGWQGRADLDLDTDIGWLPKIQVGARYTDRDAEQRTGTRDGYTELLGIPLANVPLGELQLTPDAFRGDVQGFRSWLAPTRGGILDNREALRRLTYESLQRLVAANPDDIGARNQLRDFSTVDLAYNPLQGFTAQEQTYAAYAQGQYKFDIGTVGFDGVFGVRAINTVGAYTGISSTAFGGTETREPRTTRQNYVDVLPNISLRVRPTEKFQLRFAFTKTRTQPGFGQLNPALRITQNTSPPDLNNPVARPNAFGEAGNPDLQPLTSKNYDATAEWYFSRSGSISAAFFYRDVFGFIGNYTRRVQDPVFGLIEVNRPENAGAGRIKGVELAGQTFLDFLPGWLSGFGVQGNVTYIQGKNRLPTAVVDDPPFVDITGLSKWTYNVALFYEKGPISTRVSYNSRSDFTNFYSQATPDAAFTGEATRSVTRLDASFNYTPVKSVTFTVDASNLLAKPYNNYAQYAEDRYYPRDVRDEGRYYGVGVRFRY